MKTTLIISLISIFSLTDVFSQGSTLIVFSKDGQPFHLIMNGVRQNDEPETNVRVEELSEASYQVKVIFKDETLPEIEKRFFPQEPVEATFAVQRNKKGALILRLQSMVDIAEALPAPANQEVVVYKTTPGPATTTTVTQTTHTTNASDNVNIDINMDGMGMNVHVEENYGHPDGHVHSTTTTTTGGHAVEETYEAHQMPGYNGPVGCDYPMNEADFSGAKNSISSKSFEDSKLTVAKQITGSNCLLAEQVGEVMRLFSFEDSKLEFAKYAHKYTFDQGNYFKVNDAFEFESSIDELNKYLGN